MFTIRTNKKVIIMLLVTGILVISCLFAALLKLFSTKNSYADTASNSSLVATLQSKVTELAWPDDTHGADVKPAYATVVQKYASGQAGDYTDIGGCNGVDSGAWVAILMRESGWDSDYNSGGGPISHQLLYLQNSDKWEPLNTIGQSISENQLQPGDVAIRDDHTYVYIGQIPDFSTHITSASLCSRAPSAGAEVPGDGSYYWYRNKSPGQQEITHSLTFNANGGTNPPTALSCTTTDSSCTITIPTTKPTRSDYTFIGWAETADAHSPSITLENIKNNYKISISQNKTLYAVWSPSHTLSYDLKGGTGSVPAQTCTNPESTSDGECSVTIPNVIPKREGYKFFGYVIDESVKDPLLYQPGNQFKFTSECTAPTEGGGCYSVIPKTKTLYAVWGKGEVTYESGQVYTINSDKNLVVKIDYPRSRLSRVSVDDKVITPNTDYTTESGSTIINLSHTFLDSLSAGEHTLKATYVDYDGDITAEAKFIIEGTSDTPSPSSSTNDGASAPDTGEGIGANDNISTISYCIAPIAGILIGAVIYLWNRSRIRSKIQFK